MNRTRLAFTQMLKSIFLVVVILVGCLDSLAAQLQPTFELDFKNGFDAVGRNGTIKAQLEGQPQLVDGKFGKAMKSGPDTGYLRFPTKDVIRREQGTVEMWVCPLDWDGTEEKFHVFFEVKDAKDDGAMYLYKYFQGPLLMLTSPKLGSYFETKCYIRMWKPKEWHHIAGAWSRSHICLYVDGKLIGVPTSSVLPRSLSETFRLGDNPWPNDETQPPRTSSSLIERVRIYDRFLTAEHVAAHYAGNYKVAAPLPEEALAFDLKMKVDPDTPETRRLTAQVDVMGGDVEESSLSAAFSLSPIEIPTPAPMDKTVAFSNDRAEKAFTLDGAKPGNYQLTAIVKQNGQECARLGKPIDIPDASWKGNRIGLEDKVLPPWTPIKVKEGGRVVVSCWGREYIFNENIFPSQIVSAGKEMLARPISLRVLINKEELRWREPKLDVKSTSATTVEMIGSAKALVKDSVVILRSELKAEYDGLFVVDCRLELPTGIKPNRIAIEVPMRQDVVFYRHRVKHGPQPNTVSLCEYAGSLAEGSGVVDSDTFIPWAWLGDNDRGLFWFCETSEFWPNCQEKNAFETVREAKEVTMLFNLLVAGQRFPKEWHYQFGLQATPVKPLPKDWRKWRLGPVCKRFVTPASRPTVDIPCPDAQKGSFKYFGYPDALDSTVFAQRIADFHRKEVHVTPYSCLTYLSDACGGYQWFGSPWAAGISGDTGAGYGTDWHFQQVCPKSKEYCDFIIAKHKEFMDRFGLDGYYHDLTLAYPCAKENTGCGYERDGQRIPTYPILACRSLYRRLYAMVKSNPRPTFLMGHCSGRMTIPILAYEDAYLDGEHFRDLGVKDSYLDVVTLDAFRAEYMGRQWGVMPFFLPEFCHPYNQQIEPSCGLLALLMIHDVSLWPDYCYPMVVDEAFESLDAFGYVNSDFLPYFDPVPPATTEMRDVYASAYQLPGRVLVIVANLSKEDRSGAVVLNAKRLGVPLKRVLSWPDKQPLVCRGNTVNLEVSRLGYRMLLVGDVPPDSLRAADELLEKKNDPKYTRFPKRWKVNQAYRGEISMIRDNKETHDGESCVLLQNDKTINYEITTLYGEYLNNETAILYGPYMPILSERTYRFKIWARGTGRMTIYLYQYGDQTRGVIAPESNAYSKSFELTGQWEEYSFDYSARPDVLKVRPGIHVRDQAYLEDALLTENEPSKKN